MRIILLVLAILLGFTVCNAQIESNNRDVITTKNPIQRLNSSTGKHEVYVAGKWQPAKMVQDTILAKLMCDYGGSAIIVDGYVIIKRLSGTDLKHKDHKALFVPVLGSPGVQILGYYNYPKGSTVLQAWW